MNHQSPNENKKTKRSARRSAGGFLDPRAYPRHRGFTIVELLVAMSIFAIVLTTTSISFIGSLRSQRAATKLIEANENASITIERIAREIRTGTSFLVSSDRTRLSFINAREDSVVYYLAEDLDGSENQRIYEIITLGGTPTPPFPLTSKGVNIKRLSFELDNYNDSKDLPSVEKITMSLTVGLPEGTQNISDVETRIQTTISARPLNTLPPEDNDGNGENEQGENQGEE
ncbi:MAG: type II secretion system protein [bacterium]|nr:type II secretion system protein [bacterium]